MSRSADHRGRATAAAFLGMFLLQLAWIFAVAPAAGIDEFDHIYRASSVGHGHWGASHQAATEGRGDLVEVPADIVEAAHLSCTRYTYVGHDNCNPAETLGGGKVLVASAAARYNPVFYAIVGTVAKPFHGTEALYVMRLAASLVCSAMFACAVGVTLRWARTIWPIVAVMAVATPTVLYSTVLPAPNGVEILAGLGTWTALLGAIRVKQADRAVLLYAAAGFVVPFALVRSLGPLWLALSAVSIVALAGFQTWIAIIRENPRPAGTFLASGVVATLAGGIWTVDAKTNTPEILGAFPDAFGNTIRNAELWPIQVVAAFPTRTEQAPMAVYYTSLAVIVALLVAGFAFARGRTLAALVLTIALSVVVPFVIEVNAYPTSGATWQGRYGWPFTLGALLICGYALEERSPRHRAFRIALGAAAPCWGVAQVVSPLGVLQNLHRVEQASSNPDWVGDSLPTVIVLSTAGIVLMLATVTIRAHARSTHHDVALPARV